MKNQFYIVIVATILAGAFIIWSGFFQTDSESANHLSQEDITITMYHGEGCMCCVRWADYLENEGFNVISEKVPDLFAVKEEYGVPYEINSCHTAIVEGYVVEGHVPAEDIRRLLEEQPDAIGISVPGMPPNAPGMDAPVSREYQVVLFDEADNISIYSVHN
jgi:hypothetical protein